MSPSKGSSNSSKTAHVMNLLRKSTPAPAAQGTQDAQGTQGEPAESTPPVTHTPQIPPIIAELNADAKVSSDIRDALEEALEEEAALDTRQQEQAPPPPLPAGEPAPVMEPDDEPAEPADEQPPAPPADAAPPAAEEIPLPAAQVIESEPEDEPEAEPAVEPVVEPAAETGAAPAPDPVPAADTAAAHVTAAEPVPSDEPALINVMHRLAEEKADKYISLFGLCSCKRCKDDVVALTLNALPSKYMVIRPSELAILSDMYVNRYSSAITAQLLRACNIVMENPRHDL